MNFKRKLERAKLVKPMRCCGMPMLYKESYNEYVCEICGKIKKGMKK